jgi:hypothetical protein
LCGSTGACLVKLDIRCINSPSGLKPIFTFQQ